MHSPSGCSVKHIITFPSDHCQEKNPLSILSRKTKPILRRDPYRKLHPVIRALRRDTPSVQHHDLLRDGEPQPGTARVRISALVQPVKFLKNIVQFFLRDRMPLIPENDFNRPPVFPRADFDLRPRKTV